MSVLDILLQKVAADVRGLLAAKPILLGDADPPSAQGVYALSWEGKIRYIGEAKGRKGLRDRLLSKHLSGDDRHAIQRAFLDMHPDRMLRRQHLRENVSAQWVIVDPERVSIVERVAISLLEPEHNRK